MKRVSVAGLLKWDLTRPRDLGYNLTQRQGDTCDPLVSVPVTGERSDGAGGQERMGELTDMS